MVLYLSISHTELYYRGIVGIMTNGVPGQLHRKMTFTEAVNNWFEGFVNGNLSGTVHPGSVLGRVVTVTELNARLAASGRPMFIPTPPVADPTASAAPIAPTSVPPPTPVPAPAAAPSPNQGRRWYVVIKGAQPGVYQSR